MKYLTLAIALLLGTATTATAQEMKSIEMDYSVTKKDCPRVSTAGAATGVGLGSASTVAGTMVLVMGLDQDLDPSTETRNRGMVAAGGALLGAGAVAVAISAWRVAKQRKKRAYHNEGICDAPTARRPLTGIRF
jgi:hypothetical protein